MIDRSGKPAAEVRHVVEGALYSVPHLNPMELMRLGMVSLGVARRRPGHEIRVP